MPNPSREDFISLSRIARICSLFLILVCSAAKPAVSDDLRKIALIVGNSGYQNVDTLRNPSNDATLVATALTKLKFQLIEDKPLLDLTQVQFDKAKSKFVEAARQADVALFYYAGHGVQVSGENYLVPIDADPTDEEEVAEQSINASKFVRGLATAHTTLNLIILDACRNNPFHKARSRALTANRGLAEMNAPQATVIWYATSPGKVAQDGDGDNGPFAVALAHNISAQSQDVNRIFNKTGWEVVNVTEKKQTPWIASSPIPGTFYFNTGNGEYPYPVKAGYPTVAGRRRTRAAPHGMAPALSWA